MTGAVHLKMVRELLQDAKHDYRPAKSRNDGHVTTVCTFISYWHVVNEQTLNDNGISIWSGPKDCGRAKFVPHVLLQDQMETRTVIAGKLFEQSVQADLLLKIITRGKSWVFTYDRDMKHHSYEWQTNTT